jgi:FAD/FMN-containing dehydrogenase
LKQAAAAGGIAVWKPAWRVFARADDHNGPAAPAGFPSGIPVFRQAYENWAREVIVDDLWTCTPATANDVVRVTNWAASTGYRVRARGAMHGWSPLAVSPGTKPTERVVMVDTTGLHAISFGSRNGTPPVTVGAGALLQDVMAAMETRGRGFVATPAPGDITMGGALAIDAHGASVPAVGERRVPGQTFGSLSNIVTSLTIVAWNPAARSYGLRTIDRADPLAKSVLVHLARSFVVEATLQTAPNTRVRCLSRTDIAVSEMFGPPGTKGNTFASFVDKAGRVEAIWYPFTDKPWLKVWSVAPHKPDSAREVTAPYNYPFSDNIPVELSDLASRIIRGDGDATPEFGLTAFAVSKRGLTATRSADIWGWSRNVLLYIKPTTMRVTANGYAVVTRRADIQRVVHEFTTKFVAMRDAYRRAGQYPINMPIEIRASGLDHAADSVVPGAEPPALSAISPDPAHPDRDVAIWFDILTFPGTPRSQQFMHEFEQWLYAHFGAYCTVRVEWSKGWAYHANRGAWTDTEVIGNRIPASLTQGRSPDSTYTAAVHHLGGLDPHRVFTSPLVDALMP